MDRLPGFHYRDGTDDFIEPRAVLLFDKGQDLGDRGSLWSAPIEWSSLIFGAWSAFGLSERCFRALVGGMPERCAV